ncbi:hypothetical protein [Legionella genomosp. 1]|uniref:hypothetical protein n=1 Tax=Legionella genomosp. 1 TaxID=1093625 RepID=UPI001055873B|nr:hypothetical protein [Legionella genomosp. 1]
MGILKTRPILTREYTSKSKDDKDDEKSLARKKAKDIKLGEKPDTCLNPLQLLTPESVKESLKIGTNELMQQSCVGDGMVNMLGNGVPGYYTTGVDAGIDETAEQFDETNNLNNSM